MFSITFITNGGTPIPPIVLEGGAPLVAPKDPTQTGYTFDAWFLDVNFANRYMGFPQFMSYENLILYAKWNVNTYHLGYNTHAFSEVKGGLSHSIALDNFGRVYTWGHNSFGQLGNQTLVDENNPTILPFHQLSKDEFVFRVQAKENSTYALTNKGNLYAWGRNQFGQLGNGSTSNLLKPTPVIFNELTTNEVIIEVQPGEEHAIALTNLGNIFAWGRNDQGQLGDGTTENRKTPVISILPNNLLSNEIFIQISTGTYHNHALTNLGRVFGWGGNSTNEIGDGTGINRINFVMIKFNAIQPNEKIKHITSGGYTTFALTDQHRLFAWGWNWYGQLGTGDITNRLVPVVVQIPQLLTGESISKISTGYAHTVAITNQGRLFQWGLQQANFLGDSQNSHSTVHIPVSLSTLQNLEYPQAVSTGRFHSFFITNQGRLFSWGYNGHGQVGNGTTTRVSFPMNLNFIKEVNVNFGALSPVFTYYNFGQMIVPITLSVDDYRFWGWSTDLTQSTYFSFSTMPASDYSLFARWTPLQYEVNYVLDGGVNSEENPVTFTHESDPMNLKPPVKNGYRFIGWYDNAEFTGNPIAEVISESRKDVSLFAKWAEIQPFQTITTGSKVSFGLTENHEVFMWGDGQYNAVGKPEDFNLLRPEIIAISNLNQAEFVVDLRAGSNHTLALTSQGRVFAFGLNSSGQLGDATFTNRLAFEEVIFTDLQSEETIVKIQAGGETSFALTSQARLFGWGYNGNGFVGNGSQAEYVTTPSLIPLTALNQDEKVLDIRASDAHALIVTDYGQVYGWGTNVSNQLTNSAGMQKRSPFLITIPELPPDEDITLAEPGNGFTLVVTTEGRMFGWGLNYTGQLGFFSEMNAISPVLVPFNGLLDQEKIINIEAGSDFAIALTSLGRVFSWGTNWLGQLATEASVFRRYIPDLITFSDLDQQDSIQSIHVGNSFAFARSVNGRLFAWGLNDKGQLGDGTTTTKFNPVKVLS